MDTKYVAGYFDGEGYVGLYWNKGSIDPRYKSGKRPGCWVRTVGINNTFPTVIKELHAEFGGTFRILRNKTKKHKTIYTWSMGSVEGIKKFLTAIIPHLREKCPQAKLMLDCLEGKIPHEKAALELKEYKHV